MTKIREVREVFTAGAAMALLRQSEDDNRLWHDAMRRVRRASITPDALSAALAQYRALWDF